MSLMGSNNIHGGWVLSESEIAVNLKILISVGGEEEINNLSNSCKVGIYYFQTLDFFVDSTMSHNLLLGFIKSIFAYFN